MKTLLTIAFIGFYVATINGGHHFSIPKEVKEKLKGFKKECLAEVPNIDKDHLDMFNNHEYMAGDKDLEKLVFCFHTKTDMQNQDGSYNVKGMKAYLAEISGKPDHYDNHVDECTKVDHHNALENAWAFAMCMNAKVGHMGYQ